MQLVGKSHNFIVNPHNHGQCFRGVHETRHTCRLPPVCRRPCCLHRPHGAQNCVRKLPKYQCGFSTRRCCCSLWPTVRRLQHLWLASATRHPLCIQAPARNVLLEHETAPQHEPALCPATCLGQAPAYGQIADPAALEAGQQRAAKRVVYPNARAPAVAARDERHLAACAQVCHAGRAWRLEHVMPIVSFSFFAFFSTSLRAVQLGATHRAVSTLRECF